MLSEERKGRFKDKLKIVEPLLEQEVDDDKVEDDKAQAQGSTCEAQLEAVYFKKQIVEEEEKEPEVDD